LKSTDSIQVGLAIAICGHGKKEGTKAREEETKEET
jgi:hypothetical protein